jgi:hypothetical protein
VGGGDRKEALKEEKSRERRSSGLPHDEMGPVGTQGRAKRQAALANTFEMRW